MTQPAGLQNSAIAAYAERVGTNYSIYDSSGQADISALLNALGGRIEYSDRPEASHVWEKGNFVVFIPNSTSRRRDRFTIAHELGHYFLHYLYPKRSGEMSFGRGGRNRAETEANVFASALLMPDAPFRRAWRELGADEWHVARRFDVSPAAAQVRASILNLA
ncbi:ImmA/IrrE family metallo-endopeptidase [Cellulosimicrobium aquatile]|uniref:ImmA/IrrE family metallo-endopeptidase n=1 Tax=Cellulosimicrobium aquatile TaxID=1612203 RepID=UPI001459E603|nr:ImmA/IrrE family metallo-endopeptidase [Cellulosimicrobium aquatile]NMF27969.1 ImmA/IrrE family metallo-endopeptidase [Cellulosimicrobium aquatile]